MSSVAVIPI